MCLEVLHQPVRTRFGHVFCGSCIATSLKNNKWTCPYCWVYLPSEGVPGTDVARRMKSEFQNCAECDALVCLSEMRAHIRTCEKYIETYGPLQELEETTREWFGATVCPGMGHYKKHRGMNCHQSTAIHPNEHYKKKAEKVVYAVV
ncbi:E3 ubiquitin-protein ligase RNF125 [Heterocephalus glaber]|uniref:RING-type E3 ubiquitin transferase n=1 Tax=Heterocephalus glaber TaxID=10181 RepID=G5AXE0_HETGA|nr:E3 ubiquitin-protein ligase RNF125 [Heterocephalus glaber]